jgi:hypothetical protein
VDAAAEKSLQLTVLPASCSLQRYALAVSTKAARPTHITTVLCEKAPECLNSFKTWPLY